MVQAQIRRGRIQLRDPIPPAWEGRFVKIAPLSPEDELPDLEEQLMHLHALGPMEFEPGEQTSLAAALAELDAKSKKAMNTLGNLAS
jgi:hypothetical protein